MDSKALKIALEGMADAIAICQRTGSTQTSKIRTASGLLEKELEIALAAEKAASEKAPA